MTYDEKLAERIRRALPPTEDIVEKKMFGGLALLLDGKMFVGINDKDLMVRVGADAYEATLARPHVRPMDFTGRPLTGYVYVSAAGSRTDDAVAAWIRQAIEFVRTLPTKKTPRPARRPRRPPNQRSKPKHLKRS
jgi:TfoX/Sxy family transcriptional regulator of competence genes